jgi:hypothetical protein
MALFHLIRFLVIMVQFSFPTEDMREALGESWPYQLRWHRSMLGFILALGILAPFAGILVIESRGSHLPRVPPGYGLILTPTGIVLGFGLACLIAPRTFLQSPLGEYWLKFLGARRILFVRLAAFCLALFFGLGLLGFLALFLNAEDPFLSP